jgi:hypothetical protein
MSLRLMPSPGWSNGFAPIRNYGSVSREWQEHGIANEASRPAVNARGLSRPHTA